jgi:hypothetical protein
MRMLCVLALVMAASSGCNATLAPDHQQDVTLANWLLTEADLPMGFRAHKPESTDRPTSDHPDCENTLHSLEIAGPPPSATEARTAFMAEDGTIVQHVVRLYPDDGADAALRDAARILAGCTTFELRYPDGMTMTESVNTLTSTDNRWTGDVVADTGALSVHNRLTLLSAGKRLAILSIVTADQADDNLVATITNAARAKLD